MNGKGKEETKEREREMKNIHRRKIAGRKRRKKRRER